MSQNKKYYWLKLKDTFFTDKRIKKLRKIAGGDTYTIIYLKIQLLSLQDEGNLYFDNVENTFEEEIALQIDEDVEDVKITISYLIRNNLLQEINENTYELLETKNCIGSETRNAESMRKLRERKNKGVTLLQNVTNCYTEKEKEIEIEKEIDTEKEKTKEIIKCYEENIGLITPAVAETLFSYDDIDKELIIYAIKRASVNNKRSMNYIQGILNNWIKKGIKTVLDAENEEQEYKNKQKPKEETIEERIERYKREWGEE